MTAKELIAQLKTLKPDTKVYMSRDAEGNGYEGVYEMSAANIYDGEQVPNDKVKADILYPDDCHIEIEDMPGNKDHPNAE